MGTSSTFYVIKKYTVQDRLSEDLSKLLSMNCFAENDCKNNFPYLFLIFDNFSGKKRKGNLSPSSKTYMQ